MAFRDFPGSRLPVVCVAVFLVLSAGLAFAGSPAKSSLPRAGEDAAALSLPTAPARDSAATAPSPSGSPDLGSVPTVGGPATAQTPALSRTPPFGEGASRAFITSSTSVLLNGTDVPGNFLASPDLDASNLVVDPGRGLLFGVGNGDGNVSVISESTNEVVGSIPVLNPTASAFAYDPAQHEVWVGESYCSFPFMGYCFAYGGILVALNESNNSTAGRLYVDAPPWGLAYDAAKGELFASLPDLNEVAVVNDTTDSLVTEIPVGTSPYGIAYDPQLGELFVANAGSNNISVIDDTTNHVVADVPVGTQPGPVAFDPTSDEVFAVNQGTNNVSVIAGSADRVVGDIDVGIAPDGAAYDPATSQLFVSNANYTCDNVSVINARTDQVSGSVEVGYDPVGVVVDPARGVVYVANWYSANLTVISTATDTAFANVTLDTEPDAVTYDSAKGEVFVGDWYQGVVDVLSETTHRLLTTIPVSGVPWDLAYDPAQGEVFVSSDYPPTVFVINDTTDTVVANISVYNGNLWDYGLTGLAYDPGHGELFVGNGTGPGTSVAIISTRTDQVVTNVQVGEQPAALAYDRAKGEVFVANSGSSNVSVINDTTDRVVRNITTEGGWGTPDGILYDPLKGEIFVADEYTANVTVINDSTDRVVANIDVGTPSMFMAFDPADRAVVVTHPGDSNVSIVSDLTDRVVQTVAVGYDSTDAAYDARTSSIFVTNEYQGTVSVLTPVDVEFRAAGLPAGSNWSVSVGSPSWTQENTTGQLTGVLLFSVPFGKLSYSIAAPQGYGVSQVTGPGAPNLTADRILGSTVLTIHFAPLERVDFFEFGLSSGTWTVTIDGQTGTSPAPFAIFFVLPSGVYSFHVGTEVGYKTFASPWRVALHTTVVVVMVKFVPYHHHVTLYSPTAPNPSEPTAARGDLAVGWPPS